jgi:hypothetical protein
MVERRLGKEISLSTIKTTHHRSTANAYAVIIKKKIFQFLVEVVSP